MEGGGLTYPFPKNEKSVWYWEKDPDCIHFWVKKEKKLQMFSLRGAFFWRNDYQSALIPWNLPSPEIFFLSALTVVIIIV